MKLKKCLQKNTVLFETHKLKEVQAETQKFIHKNSLLFETQKLSSLQGETQQMSL